MTQETYLYFLKLINNKITDYKSENLYSFYKDDNNSFKFFLSFIYFLILKEYIIKKDKRETEFGKKYISNLFAGDLENFFRINNDIIKINNTLHNDYIFIIDTIRDSLLHGLFTLDINSKKIVLNNEMKNFDAKLNFDFFTKFMDFEFGRKYKINNEKIQLVISDYDFYNELLLNSNVKFKDLFFLNINITLMNPISKQELWNLKCNICDILSKISNYIDKDFDLFDYSNYGILLNKILSDEYPSIMIETSKLNENEIKKDLIKYSANSANITNLESRALCSNMEILMKYHYDNSSKKVLDCLHDTYISLNKIDDAIFIEKDQIILDAIQAILNNCYDIENTPRTLRNKYKLTKSNEDYDFYHFYFNKEASQIRKMKKLYKEGVITKKKYYEVVSLTLKERNEQYSNNVYLIEPQDEYIIKKYMNNHNMDYELGIQLNNIKLINEKLYIKYKNRLLKNNVQSMEDYNFDLELKKNNSVKWAENVRNRTYFYADIMPLMFLYMIGLGLYATNKDIIDLSSINIDNIKCYTVASYKDYELRKDKKYDKIIELEEQKQKILIQLEKCSSEKGKISISKIINEIELEIQKINTFLNIEIIDYNGINMRLCDKENTLRIIRNVFSHPGRITLENLSDLNIKLCDYNDNHELVALINCNIKDLIKMFDTNVIFKSSIDITKQSKSI